MIRNILRVFVHSITGDTLKTSPLAVILGAKVVIGNFKVLQMHPTAQEQHDRYLLIFNQPFSVLTTNARYAPSARGSLML